MRPPRNSEPLADAEHSEFFADDELKTEAPKAQPPKAGAPKAEPVTAEVAVTEPVAAEVETETAGVAAAEVAAAGVVAAEPVMAEPVPAENAEKSEPVKAEKAEPVTAEQPQAEPVEPAVASDDAALPPPVADHYAEPVEDPEPPSAAPAVPRRTLRQSIGQAGYTLAPYWFVASGVLLGVGGVVEDKALAGACGAVAGVTAGLVYQNRARYYRRQAESLRDRLRTQRLESETAAASMRESMRALRTEVWELRLSARVSEMTTQLAASRRYDPEEKARIAALATQPLDFSELRDTPVAASVAADLAANRPAPIADPKVSAADAETDSPMVILTKSADSAEEKAAEAGQSAEPADAESASADPEVIDETSEATAADPSAEVSAADATAAEATADGDAVEDDTEDVASEDVARDDVASEDDDAAEGEGARVIDLRGSSNKPSSQQEHTAVAG